LTTVAFDRASPDDVKQMRSCLLDVGYAGDAGTYLEAVMELHRVIARAAQIPVLDGMHETVIAAIRATLRGANFIDGHEEMLRHSVQVHEGIVDSIATRERAAFAKFVGLHDQDLVRAEDPSRSPHIENPDPASVHQTR
jgi:DNA-binding FadR family transcriptional regulator